MAWMGLIKMTLKADFTHVIDKTDHFFIEENGQKLPLFIEKQVFDGRIILLNSKI